MDRAIQTTSTREGSVHYDVTGPTAESVAQEVATIMVRYHPLGYGTSFSPPMLGQDGLWHSRGSRRTSCD